MSVDVIHQLKKIVAEAKKIADWQMDIYTMIHNIDASWIVSGRLSWDRMPFKTWAELLAQLTNNVNDYLNLSSLQIGGTMVIDSNRVLQNISSIAQSLLPSSDNAFDLGSSSYKWRNVYAVNIYTGDLVFTNGWRVVEDPSHGLVVIDDKGRKYRFVLEEVEKK